MEAMPTHSQTRTIVQYQVLMQAIQSSGNSNQSLFQILANSSYAQSHSHSSISQLMKSLQRSMLKTIANGQQKLQVSEIKEREQPSGENTTIRNILQEMSFGDSIYWEYMAQDLQSIIQYANSSKKNKKRLDLNNQELLAKIRKIEPSYNPSAANESVLANSKLLKEKTQAYKKQYISLKELNGRYEKKIAQIKDACEQ